MILSSYMFASNGGAGFPDGLSDCKLYTGQQAASACLGTEYDKAFVATAVSLEPKCQREFMIVGAPC
jgi:alpha-amylase